MRQAYDYWQDQPGLYEITVGIAGKKFKHTSPQRLNTIFPTTVVETKAATWQPPPASTHKQPTTNDKRGVNEPPVSPEAGPKPIKKEREFLQEYLSTKPENQDVQANAAHAVEQVVAMYLVTARPCHYTKRPPERQRDQQDHTPAGRRGSRRSPRIYIGKPGASPS